ncbi:MAG: cupin domain-containing protein [Rhodobacteraceae bacterium]|nr:cupin domain-containing protein [Paracoccaceae bacterium]
MPKEKVTDQISRRLVTGQQMMLAHVYLAKGAIVPKHQHHNEQLTYILEGSLRFWIGENGEETMDVRAGEVLHIPSNVWHKAEALEDTLDVDVFSPAATGLARQDRRLPAHVGPAKHPSVRRPQLRRGPLRPSGGGDG